MAGETAVEAPASDDITVSGNADAGFAPPPPAVPAADVEEPAEPDEPAEAVAADAASEAGKQLAKKKVRLQDRIDELNWEKHASKREADAAKAEAAALRKELEALKSTAPAPAAPKPAEDGKPNREAFTSQIGTTYATYEAAQDAYDDARDAWREKQAEQRQQAKRASDSVADAYAAATKRIDAFRKEHTDYDDVVKDVQVPPGPGRQQLFDHLTFSESGVALAYHLAKFQPDELSRLASLPPAYVVEALGELKASLKLRPTGAPTGPPAASPAFTPAKPPIKPVGSSPVTSDDVGDPDDLSESGISAHIKRENAKDLKRRRR